MPRDTFLCHNLFFSIHAWKFISLLSIGVCVFRWKIYRYRASDVQWTNRRLDGETSVGKKRAMTIFVQLFSAFYWFSLKDNTKNGGKVSKKFFFPFRKLHVEANLIMASSRESALQTTIFAAQFISSSSLEVVKLEFITIIYRDGGKIFMEDPLKCEQRAKKNILIKNSNWYQSCLTSGHNLKITIYIKVPTTASDAFEKKIFIATLGLLCN